MDSGGEAVARVLACRLRISSRFVGGLEYAGWRMPLLRALAANPDDVVDEVFVVVNDPSVESEVFCLPVLPKVANFFRVNRTRFS